MLIWIEKSIFVFHCFISAYLLLMPITNIIAIWAWPLRIFNVAFLIIVTIFQATYWPKCPLTLLYNRVRDMNGSPRSKGFVKDVLAIINIFVTNKQVQIIQLIILSLTIMTFLLWL